jgi:hypothetical protein
VKQALRDLGGSGHLSEINQKVESHPRTTINPTWRDTIRRVLRQYKDFEPLPPERSGRYRLVELPGVEPGVQELTGVPHVDHGMAQGMLLSLGRVYRYDTFAPARDRLRQFQDRPLDWLVTVRDVGAILPGKNLPQIREIDVMWFDEDDHGLFPTYAFEVEETTGVKSGLDRLLKIPRRFSISLYVVAPGEAERRKFDLYVAQTPFRDFAHRFAFRSYPELEALYNSAIEHEERVRTFGIMARGRGYGLQG